MINNRQNGRRRGRGGAQVRNGGGGGNGPDRGNRIDNRSRGNAAQLLEKYKNLARDAQMQGDRVMTEYYLQFADHYFRVLGESRQRFEEQNPNQNQSRRQRDEFGYDEDGDDGDNGDADSIENAYEERRQRAPAEEQRRERVPEPRRERPDAPAPHQAPRVEYAVEGEEVRAGEEEGRRGRRRRPRSNGESHDGVESAEPRLEADRLPPAFAPDGEPAPRANGKANGRAAEPAPVEAPVAEEGEEPVRRRRTRRAKVTEDGDSSVAA